MLGRAASKCRLGCLSAHSVRLLYIALVWFNKLVSGKCHATYFRLLSVQVVCCTDDRFVNRKISLDLVYDLARVLCAAIGGIHDVKMLNEGLVPRLTALLGHDGVMLRHKALQVVRAATNNRVLRHMAFQSGALNHFVRLI